MTNANPKLVITAEDKTAAAFASLQSRLERSESNAVRLIGALRGVAPALAGLLVAGGALGGLRSIVDGLDKLNDVADATGATVERLSALEDIARRNGGTLDDVGGILVKFNSALKDADGKNGVSQALKAIGLDAAELRKQDPAEALQKVAGALAGYANDGDKARLVQELFGKSIKDAAPFLKDLAEAGALNAKVTQQQAEAAERFNKQLFGLQTNASGLARALTSEVIPALSSYLDKVLRLPKNLDIKYAEGGAFQSGEAYRKAVDSIEAYQELLRKDPSQSPLWNRKIDELRAKLPGLARDAAAATDKLKGLLGPGDPIAGAGRGFVNPDVVKPGIGVGAGAPSKAPKVPGKAATPDLLFGSSFPLSDVWSVLEATDVAKIQQINDQISKLQGYINGGTTDPRFTQALSNLQEQLSKLEGQTQLPFGPSLDPDELERRNRALGDMRSVLDSLPSSQVERIRDTMEQLNIQFDGGAKDSDKYRQAMQVLQDEMDRANGKGQDLAATMRDALGDSLYQALQGNFNSIGEAWSRMILDMVAKAAAADLQNAIFGSGKGGNLAALGTSALKLFGVPGFASGGDHQGGLRVVGERGRELEWTGPSRIFNADQTRQILSGQGGSAAPVYNINVAAGVGAAEVYAGVQLAIRTADVNARQLMRRNGGA